MPAPEQASLVEEGQPQTRQEAASTGPGMEPETTATTILASVKEQELQFQRLTRELEVERQIVASQLERCRLGAESPSIASTSSTEKSFPWRSTDVPNTGVSKPRVSDAVHPNNYLIRTEPEQGTLYSPEQTSLHESEGSLGNSRSSTQMNSYSDSGYQEAGSFHNSQNVSKADNRQQHSFIGSTNNHVVRNSRAEGQTLVQPSVANRAMRRVSSVPSRAQSPSYVISTGVSPSRGSLRTSLGSGFGSPSVTDPRPLNPSAYSSTTLPAARAASPYSQRPASPTAIRRIGSVTSRQTSNPNGPTPQYQTTARVGSPLTLTDAQTRVASPSQGQVGSSSPKRSGMTAVPQHLGPSLQRTVHDMEQFGQQQYDIYERMVPPRPDSLTGLRSSYASQHSQLGQDLRSAVSPDLHITPIYEGRTYYSPVYRSPNHGTVELQGSQTALYRTGSVGIGNLQRTSSQRSTLTYQRNNYALNTTATYAEPYRPIQYRVQECNYNRLQHAVPADDGTTRSPSIDSIQKDPREFAWRDPELPEVIHMLQHQFPSVQANAAAYLQHLCFGDNKVKMEVCRLGGIKHLVDLLDHRVLEVQKNACGALRNLVFGKSTDENKIAMKNVGGIPALLRLLRKSIDAEVRELVTGVLWNLSSCDAVKMTIIRDALSTLTNTVIVPHSGWNNSSFDDDHKIKFQTSLVLRNTTGCLRNLSSAGEEARKQMRSCEGLVDSLLYVIHTCVNTSDYDSKTVENCVCTLRNLSYRLELEVPQARLLGLNELDDLLGKESPSKDSEPSCWGKKKKKKKRTPQEDQWDGVGPIPGLSKSPKGVEMLWHPSVVKPYLTLLAESSNPATLEGSAGSLQNLSAGNWKFAAYIRAAVRKEKGLPILVELLRMDNDRVVSSVATALRNMALDVRNKELIGKYAMRDLVNRLPGGNGPSVLSDETMAAICCALHEVTSKNMENAKALADSGGIEKLVNITKGRGDRSSLKVVKAAAQVLNTLWQYRDLRSIYKKDGWNQNHFITPVSTLERDRFKSHPSLSTTNQQMSPIIQSVGSTSSSPALLGIRDPRSEYDRTQPPMQYYNSQGDATHKGLYPGSSKPSPIYISSYSSPAREQNRRLQHQQLYYSQDDSNRKNFDAYRLYLQSSHSYEDPYFDDRVHFPASTDYSTQYGLKSTTNYVDFYSTKRPSYRAEQYPGSPDSWV
ncbi:plakophilin-4 isoform X2 [Hylobates moloch]|uniref:plakophilin-4 isoform X2 n=2 Tax=Hylobates moloch TaxID=81572 RepID=UPI0013F1C520|nr:plakophilin-4 isoform X2 [Hylobates moloch]XP_032611533.1 plakophilin-4 isoform X2 [Hylobates moloch]XP_055148007.1 plakophilin-4 isoform X1 [Symphalangus syndactylus]XP_055148008.1 plakophilin-4 isoform X1 [Symphalangus syndactylus]XP_055148009.1 plakophilin-4 isoform X1 [Symphalangus syndactylus]XP_058297769.1 plakophilin-4 isoform X2 [Hylobates moloch]